MDRSPDPMTVPRSDRSTEQLRISVVTPVLNGEGLVAETIRSVVSQSVWERESVIVDYVVQDGGSTDATHQDARDALGDRGRLQVEEDRGMYDALARAWRSQPKADIYCYLNAGDLMLPGALELVLDAMRSTKADWLMGLQVYFSRAGVITNSYMPFRYTRRFLEAGAYGRGLHHIQQESQYWSGALMEEVDLEEFARFRLAGDYYLWRIFARRATPTVIAAGLSGFRFHGGHLGADSDRYWKELEPHLVPLSRMGRVAAVVERQFWRLPWRFKYPVVRPLEYRNEVDVWSGRPGQEVRGAE